jgi:ubiquinone/menaquinone biosynthesis C-methylase UbiE
MEAPARPRENWADESYVAYWLEREATSPRDRLRDFRIVRSLIPRTPDEPFRYMNIGCGDGPLDEVLLEEFGRARATLVDGSETMLTGARRRLERFGDRVDYVRVDLASHDWAQAVGGPFDVVVSTIAIHNLRIYNRVRDLYGEAFDVMAEGGFFLNFDYVRPNSPALRPLASWASRDPEVGHIGRSSGNNGPGTLEEHLIWLRAAGFGAVDCFFKEFGAAAYGGFKGAVRIPKAE